MNKNNKLTNLLAPIMFTLVTLGPIGWFFVDYVGKKYDRLGFLFCSSIILTILSVIFWVLYFKYNKKSK